MSSRRPKCSVCHKKPPAKGRGGKCHACYQRAYRAGERLRPERELGSGPGRLDYVAPRALVDRFYEAVPKSQRGAFLCHALNSALEAQEKTT